MDLKIYLPKRSNVYKTGGEDPVFFHYFPIVRLIYRKRLANTLQMLGNGVYENLLEIGYGSGLLLPELKGHCQRLFAVDIHENRELVYKMLVKESIKAELAVGSILNLPYEKDFFDGIVSVSVLEHIVELDEAISEIKRVMKMGGIAVFSFPVKNKITDSFYRLVGYSPADLHPSGHREIENAVNRQLKIVERMVLPSIRNPDYGVYMTLRCVKE